MSKKKSPPTAEELSKDIHDVVSVLENESDRGLVLVAAAYLDDMLTALIREKFVEDQKITEELLGTNGPLGTFSAKINLAYCIGLLHSNARSDLRKTRQIRNKFAHMRNKASFEDRAIQDKCSSLTYASKPIASTDDPTKIARGGFLLSMVGLLGLMSTTASTISRTTRSGKKTRVDH